MAWFHLENGNCTKKVDKGRGTHCYLIPVGTKHPTHNICRQIVQCVWCRCNDHTTNVEVVRWKSWTKTEVAICHHHVHECCGWRDLSLNQLDLHSSTHAVGFATLAMNMSAVCECAAHRCQNKCLTGLCSTEYPFQTLTCLAHWWGEKRLKTKCNDVHLMTLIAEVQKWLWGKNISCCCWAIGNLIVRYRRCLNHVERQGTNIHILSYALLVSTYICFSKPNKET